MTTDKIKPGQGPQRPKPAAPKPPAKAAARPMGKPLPYLGATRQQAPSQAFMPRGVNLGRIMMPDNTRVARKPPTFASNQQRAKLFPLPQRPKQAAKPGLLGRLWGEVKNVGRGARDAVVDTVKGTYEVIRHPKQTAKALIHLAKNPKEIVTVAKTMWKDATKHGVGYAVGYIGANLAPMLLTGGSSGASITGRVLSVAGKTRTVQLLARTPVVARNLGRVAKAAGKVQQVTGKASTAASKASQAVRATRAGQAVARTGQKLSTRLAKPAERLARLREAAAAHRYVKNAKAAYQVVKRPVDQVRQVRERVVGRIGDRLEHAVRKADDRAWATPKSGAPLRKADLAHPTPASNPRFAEQMHALRAKLDEVRGGGETGPAAQGRVTARRDQIERYEQAFEHMAINEPEALAALQKKAFQEAGLTKAEIKHWDDAVASWTGEMNTPGIGRFSELDDFHAYFREANRLYESTGDHARALGETGVYAKEGGSFGKHLKTASQRVDAGFLARHAPTPDQLEKLQELTELVAKVRGTRQVRRDVVGAELGLPPLDASHLELFRGTGHPLGVKGIFEAWEAGADSFKMPMRHGESFSASYEVASDFSMAGPRSSGTQAREAAEGSAIFWIDAPRERVITDKYLDMGAHSYREHAQRSQMEYVLQFTEAPYKVPVDNAVIQFKGEFYGRGDLAALKDAIKRDPEAWARVTTPRP